MTEYEVLHYPGDRTGWEDCQPGRLMGTNELGRPWEVLDAECETLYCDGARHGGVCPGHVRTTVHLQTASPEAIQAALGRMRPARVTQQRTTLHKGKKKRRRR